VKYPERINIHPSAVRETKKPIVDKLRGGYYTDAKAPRRPLEGPKPPGVVADRGARSAHLSD